MGNTMMRATSQHPFGGGLRAVGDEFEVGANEVETFRALGWAVPATESAAKAPAPSKATVMTSKPAAKAPQPKPAPAVKTAAMKAKKGKAGYKTRALTSKG